MFIRKTRKTDAVTKKSYFSYQLIEAVRTERGPRQHILLNLGQIRDLDIEQLKELANRIETIMSGQTMCVLPSQQIESLAQAYASQLILRLSNAEPQLKSSQPTKPKEFVTIDMSSVEQCEPRSVGAEHLMLEMARQLQLPEQLAKLGLSETEKAIALGSIIARAVNPESERSTYAWLCHESGLGELIDFDFKKSSLNKLYQISDKLLPHKDSLELHFEDVECKFHGYTNTIALYDLTNIYMEGQAKQNPKAKFGRSKEKRSDCPLVTMGLVMNNHGFLHRTSILPGNASEPKTLEGMIKHLSVHHSLIKPTIVLDAGISTEANLTWLKENKYSYVVSARQNAPSLELEGDLVAVEDTHDLVKAALIKSPGDSEEKWLYCESEAKAAVASKMKQSFKIRFENDLKKISEGLLKPKGRKKYLKVLERIGRLKEKHKQISGCYEVNILASEDGRTATSIEWKVIEEKLVDKLTGSYFLRTNLIHLEAKDLWQLYNTLRSVEDAFRFMKSSLGLRPVHHQLERRVDGHLWITIMAYHLIQHCLYQLKQQGIRYEWRTVRKIIRSRARVTTLAKMKNGQMLYLRNSTKAEGEQKDIYRALRLSSSILRTYKTII